MLFIYSKWDGKSNKEWPTKARVLILSNDSFLKAVHYFEKNIGRAVGVEDMGGILKEAKVKVAVKNGSSALTSNSPTQRSWDNYLSLLPQLEPIRSATSNVQTISEARYIAERSFSNAVSHTMTIAVAHYQLGAPDRRFKSIEMATVGA